MNITNLIRIALTALQRNKLRAFLTMLGVIIGVASVIVMLAIGEGSKQSIKEQISSMGSNMLFVQPGSDQRGGVRQDFSQSKTLTLVDLQALQKNATYLSDISPQVNGSGQVIYSSKNWPTSVYGVSPAFLNIRKLSINSGSMFTDKDVASAAKVAVIGQTIVENLFGNENPIGKTIRFNKIPFRVIGVLDEKGQNTFGQDQDDIILAPYTTVQKRIQAATHLQSITASAQSEEVAEAAVEQVETILRASHKLKDSDDNNFTVRSQQELISTFSSTSEMMTVLLVAIASISLVIGGIGIMNIMYVSVTERTREIGLRMAVGGRGKDILLQFLLEAILISITGGVLGVVLGLSSTFVVSSYLSWPVVITANSIIISFTVCAITGIFFGWYPARKASAADPIVALRYE
ncbi:MAG: ABC transporter permease [Bacteroidota bacterium]|nr:MAG: multidrug ABC transporter substrate-binding protein [Bacteroidetes bacterium OLB12]GIL22680.1 MAG: ABC transporter permease [Bacteroidota bacterium]HNR73927.1 ABC transporter permease [Cyclobacteriaceae bacterium]HNU42904.1 ABC transporter permease [Cyclobacteriaceae bacterium]